MSEPLLPRGPRQPTAVYSCCENLFWNTTVPLICILTAALGLLIGLIVDNDLSYDEIYVYGRDGISTTATLSLICWTLMLLVFNLYEWIGVRRSKYYISSSTNKSYIFTSLILFFYIITLCFQEDLYATIIPTIFLFKFLGVEPFYDISKLFCTCDHCCCCNMHRWFRAVTYICVIIIPFVLIVVTIADFDPNRYEPEKWVISEDLLIITLSLFQISMLAVIIFNIVLLISLGYYTSALYSLKVEYAPEVLDGKTLKLIQKKMWRVGIYGISILFITCTFINCTFSVLFDNHFQYYERSVFVNNISVLSLITLILYFEQPSLFYWQHQYTLCTQCKTPYVKSICCEVCGETSISTSVNKQSQTVTE
eukprot:321304_1